LYTNFCQSIHTSKPAKGQPLWYRILRDLGTVWGEDGVPGYCVAEPDGGRDGK
jgi:hypothetical protein